MRDSSPLITCSGVLLSKNKYKTCRHSLEFTSNRKIYNLYFWGVREKRASIRLSLLTCLVWSRLHGAKIKRQFCFVFPIRLCAKPLFLTMLLLKSALPSFQFCPQFCWKGPHRHIWDTNHRKGGMVLSFQKTKRKAQEPKATSSSI